jgi:hypothetical protein
MVLLCSKLDDAQYITDVMYKYKRISMKLQAPNERPPLALSLLILTAYPNPPICNTQSRLLPP